MVKLSSRMSEKIFSQKVDYNRNINKNNSRIQRHDVKKKYIISC